MSKPVLLEKSPRHMMMTRLLQHWFGSERSTFVVVMKHPLSTIRDLWEFPDKYSFDDCGEEAIRNWFVVDLRCS